MTTKKISTKKAIINCAANIIEHIFGPYVLDCVDFDLKTHRLSLELSTKAYGDGWDFYAEYNRKTKVHNINSYMYEDEFYKFIKQLYSNCTNIKDVSFHFCGD